MELKRYNLTIFGQFSTTDKFNTLQQIESALSRIKGLTVKTLNCDLWCDANGNIRTWDEEGKETTEGFFKPNEIEYAVEPTEPPETHIEGDLISVIDLEDLDTTDHSQDLTTENSSEPSVEIKDLENEELTEEQKEVEKILNDTEGEDNGV